MAISEANKCKKWGLVIDVTRCDGCGCCLLSVKDEYTGNNYPGYAAPQPMEGQNWLDLKEVEQGEGSKIKMDYIPVMFPHDRNFKLSEIPGAPEGSVYVREDGLTIIDPVKAKGCKAIYEYFEKVAPGTVFWNEELQLPQTYILDAHRLDEGEKLPRCAEGCPTQAMHFGDLNDPESEVSQFVAAHADEIGDLFPKAGADYAVRYYKLPKPFLTGEVMLEGCADCVKDAKIVCKCLDCGCVKEATTDFFGDFELRDLTAGKEYELTVSYAGYADKTLKVKLDKAKDLGVITLAK